MNSMNDEKSESMGARALTDQEDWPSYQEGSLVEAAVKEAVRELQVSPEMATMCAFGAMATACQGLVDVQMPTGHQVPTSLMLLTIAESGERKTTTQNYFFKAINDLNDAAHRANQTALVEHRVEYKLWSTRRRHLERMYSKCATQEDDAITRAALEEVAEHARAEPQPARSNKFLYEDTTPQALVQMLYENAPNGCLLTSEANSIFSGKALGELDKLNTLWDGNSVIVDRISREGFILQNARLTLSLMAQPNVISRFMSKRGEEARGTGFLARFLVVKPRPMAGQRTNRTPCELPRREAFNARIRERLNPTLLSERQVLSFSEKAKDLWFRYSQNLEQQMRKNGLYYYLKDHASKLLENASRLAAVLHAFERSSDSDIEISHSTLEFCWKFAHNCSRHFREHLANEPQIVTDTNLLACYLLNAAIREEKLATRHENTPYSPDNLRHGLRKTFTLTLVKQYGPSSLRGKANAERLEAAIDLLTRLGHINKTGGSYQFSESILLKQPPELKNGELINIKELPLFTEQELCEGINSPRSQGYSYDLGGYLIKVN
ncbi:YfjI family protein [Pseudomonas indica]|uniref:YfjI family protein n=1 Tax=Pseudomonas indica TaxID=137658 RepID=UPI000BABE264|nr:YfjI family protein [Pseudomonas indica]PAU63678.1 hypothetical protein BZL42_04120 [Pseudomonas indica]